MESLLRVQLRPGSTCFRNAWNIRPRVCTRARVTRHICNVAQNEHVPETFSTVPSTSSSAAETASSIDQRIVERRIARQRERDAYKFAAVAATAGLTVLAVAATYARFAWHFLDGGDSLWLEMFSTLALVFGGAIGMEMWARFAHKALWHDYEPGWALHKSHHRPRVGPFEANDIFAVVNGVPACALCAYGFFTPSVWGGVCFGAGLGITLFGIAYMFIHDGLVHRRFPVGPIAEWPYLKRVAVAHQLHHSEKYNGAPWGLFLGPQELEKIPGAKEELDRLVRDLDFSKR